LFEATTDFLYSGTGRSVAKTALLTCTLAAGGSFSRSKNLNARFRVRFRWLPITRTGHGNITNKQIAGLAQRRVIAQGRLFDTTAERTFLTPSSSEHIPAGLLHYPKRKREEKRNSMGLHACRRTNFFLGMQDLFSWDRDVLANVFRSPALDRPESVRLVGMEIVHRVDLYGRTPATGRLSVFTCPETAVCSTAAAAFPQHCRKLRKKVYPRMHDCPFATSHV
jgi:hypothetical protein